MNGELIFAEDSPIHERIDGRVDKRMSEETGRWMEEWKKKEMDE